VRQVAENLWVLQYPLRVVGTQQGRTVTVVRLRSGDLIIHSTAPFTADDVNAIRSLGRPAWLLDVTLMHDTCVAVGRAAFPDVPHLAPEEFPAKGREVLSLRTPPAEWVGEFEVLPLEGLPRIREYASFHRPTCTLIVGDLVFNFGPNSTAWTKWFFRRLGGIRQFPGISRLYRQSIRDRDAFRASTQRIMQWDFDRLIPGHGDIIDSGAKPKLAAALAAAGF
jgi:hypothetical protein